MEQKYLNRQNVGSTPDMYIKGETQSNYYMTQHLFGKMNLFFYGLGLALAFTPLAVAIPTLAVIVTAQALYNMGY